LKHHYDVIVVGAGSMGMATGYFLAKQGVKTLLIDANDPPHTMGSHHGETRIIRHAYGEGRQYVPLALRAQALWMHIEEESGIKLFANTGVLSLGPRGSSFIQEIIQSSEVYGLPIEVLDSDEVNRRWPGWNVPDGYVGCLEATSGVLFSEECIRAMRRLGCTYGMELLVNTAVQGIDIEADGVRVRTVSGSYWAERVVVTAGAWAKRLLLVTGLNVPLQPVRKAVAWFECNEQLYSSSVFPTFMCELGQEHYYGFPSFNGSGIKVGRHDGGQPIDPDTMDRTFGSNPEDEGDLRRFLSQFMPHANGRRIAGKTCIYTLTPDEHFVIDQHPEFRQLVFAAGFSGHGFKFSSAVGEILSQLVMRGKTDQDISMFSVRRFQS
jgi:N-methyl-L-tryptophan oxidase